MIRGAIVGSLVGTCVGGLDTGGFVGKCVGIAGCAVGNLVGNGNGGALVGANAAGRLGVSTVGLDGDRVWRRLAGRFVGRCEEGGLVEMGADGFLVGSATVSRLGELDGGEVGRGGTLIIGGIVKNVDGGNKSIMVGTDVGELSTAKLRLSNSIAVVGSELASL